MSDKKTGLALLREPFSDNQISLLPKPYKKDSPKGKCNECGGFHGLPAVHLKYVGHAALTYRLLDVDPSWSWEPLAFDQTGLPLFDKAGGLWIKLTVLGVTRLGYGNAEAKSYQDVGSREKEVIGDCLRNAAMRFGAALDLWHKGDLHADDDVAPAEEKKKITEQKKEPVTINSDRVNEALVLLRASALKGKDALREQWSKIPECVGFNEMWSDNKKHLLEVAAKADVAAESAKEDNGNQEAAGPDVGDYANIDVPF